MTLYTAGFFKGQRRESLASARIIVPIVCRALEPTSVIDVGCGVGAWARVFEDAGAAVTAIDGEYVDRDQLLIPPERFIAADLTQGIPIDEKVDLAVCLEVAEHLPPDAGELLVAELARVADSVLFSAAIPHQGGTGHVNERWQDEWAEIFAAEGLEAIDVIRPQVWDDPRVSPWYAQNTLLYARSAIADRLRGEVTPPLRVVHPRLYEAQHAPKPLRREAAYHARRTLRLVR
jgi:SAM-dependent methyltransferase